LHSPHRARISLICWRRNNLDRAADDESDAPTPPETRQINYSSTATPPPEIAIHLAFRRELAHKWLIQACQIEQNDLRLSIRSI